MAGMLTSASRSALPGMMVLGLVLSVLACSPLPATEGKWRGLTIAPEDRCSPYLASDYRYPPSVEPQIAARLGGIRSKYTGRVFHSLEETDIEHIVARSEAHDSGLCRADRETRRAFAADLLNLTLAAPRLNRYVKKAKDAADWMPERNRFWFARQVVKVKRKYGLTVDWREMQALEPLPGTRGLRVLTIVKAIRVLAHPRPRRVETCAHLAAWA